MHKLNPMIAVEHDYHKPFYYVSILDPQTLLVSPSIPAATALHMSTAPAGQQYRSIKYAGESILNTNFPGALELTRNGILPSVFVTRYPEVADAQFVVGRNRHRC
jgi:hypothetical protein